MRQFYDQIPKQELSAPWLQKHFDLFLLAIIVLVGWFIRVILAVNTGGAIHPDEIYQSLEIAHKLKYGSGIVPWEYQIPVDIGKNGAIRSYLYPLVFFIIFELSELAGIPYGIDGSLTVVRIFSATYSTLLIPVVFLVSKEIFPTQKSPYLISLFASFLTMVWYQFTYFGIRTISNSFITLPLFLGIYLHLLVGRNVDDISSRKVKGLELSAGILLGLACVIRMDSIVFFAPLFLLRQRKNYQLEHYKLLGYGFLVILIIQLISDIYFYGIFIPSPFRWVSFNIFRGMSSNFGVEPIYYYVEKILSHSFYILFFALTLGLLLVRTLFYKYKKEKITDPWFFTILELGLWFLMSLLAMSLVPHKEERFIFSLFPIIMMLFAVTIKDCLLIFEFVYKQIHMNFLPKIHIKRIITQKELLVVQLTILLIISIFTTQMSLNDGAAIDWSVFHDVNTALDYVGKQEDSTGLIIFAAWGLTGGWTYLHKNISVSFISNPEEDQSWKSLPSSFNYLITPQYEYSYHSGLEEQISVNFTLHKTIYDRIDIWHRSRLAPLKASDIGKLTSIGLSRCLSATNRHPIRIPKLT